MAASTWKWLGGSNPGTISANWTLVGVGTNGVPLAGDTAIDTLGTVVFTSNPQFVGNTIELGGTAGAIAALSVGGIATFAAPTLDGTTVLTSAVPGQSTAEATVLNAAGTFINQGSIVADGPAGSSFTINVQPTLAGSVAVPGYLINDNGIEVDAGNALTIAIAANAELLNASLIRVNGGSLGITSSASALAGGYAAARGLVLIQNGGSVEFNAGFPAGTTAGVAPRFLFADGSGDLLKLDQVGQFGGRIDGFTQGDTIDIGKLTVTGLSYGSNGLLTLNDGSVTVASLVLWSGGFSVGSYAVSGGSAGSFIFSTGSNGDTLITTSATNEVWTATSGTNAWTTGSNWSSGVAPVATDSVVIGHGSSDTFSVVTGSTAQTVSSLLLDGRNATLQVSGPLTVQAQPIEDLAGSIEVTAGGTLNASSIALNGTGSGLTLDAGAVVALGGHANLGFANNGTMPATGAPVALAIAGHAIINGATLNAGPGQPGATGGAILVGDAGGGMPATLLVQNGATVTDTFAVITSDPTGFGQVTIDGAKTQWIDAGDTSDAQTTRGYMVVGYNEIGGTAAIAGAATLTVSNGATLTEVSRAYIGDTVNSSGSVTVTSGALWDVASASGGVLAVGLAGSGALTVSSKGTVKVGGTGTFVSNGTTLTAGGIGVGYSAGSSGTITVQSSGQLLDAGGLGVGEAGQGGLSVLNGGTVSLSGLGLGIGTSAGGSGTVVVSGTTGTALVTLGTATTGITVGQAGQGTLEVLSGGSLSVASSAAGIDIGQAVGSTGSVLVSGSKAVVSLGTSTSGIVVGDQGAGELDVLNGGAVSVLSSFGISAGETAGSSGTIKVSGSGATLSALFPDFGMALAYSGTALLDVESGGAVGVNDLFAGLNSDGSATILISGAGSKLTSQTQMTVGLAGKATVTVQAGATLATGVLLDVANASGSSGTVTVTGSGSKLVASGQVTVGDGGTGILNVQSSAAVTTTGLSLGSLFNSVYGATGMVAVTTGGHLGIAGNATVWAGSTLSVSGSGSGIDIGASGTYVSGAVNVESGYMLSGNGVVAAAVLNNGQVQALANQSSTGVLELQGSVTGSGTLTIADSTILQLDGGLAGTQAIGFGKGSELILGTPGSQLANAITGLSAGDRIDLNLGAGVSISNVAVSSPGTVNVTTSAGSYQLTNVSFASGSSQSFSWGTDVANGDSFIQVTALPFTWTGSVSTDFGTSGNWAADAIPSSTDAVAFVSNPGTITGSGNALSVTIGTQGTATSGTWVFNATTLTVAGQANPPPGLPSGVGFFANTVLNGGTLNSAAGTTMIDGPGGVSVTAEGGASVTTDGDTIGAASGDSGALVLTGSSNWKEQSGAAINGTVPGFLTVGAASGATGAVTVSNSATLQTGGAAVLGSVAGSTGGVTVSGNGVWTPSSGVTVGQAGAGFLTINSGGIVTATGAMAVGVASGGSGTVVVTSSGLLTGSNGNLTIGDAGTGVLSVSSNGIVTTTGSVDLGEVGTGAGTVSVASAGHFNTGELTVGDAGLGSLSIQSAGAVVTNAGSSTALGAIIANATGSDGSSVSVTGSGSAWTITGALEVGNGASGGLQVSGGGSVSASSLDAGVLAGGVGLLSLTGSGSDLAIGGLATVGDAGSGGLSVQSGATVSAAALSVAAGSGSSGVISLSGSATSLGVTGAANIGVGGAGELSILGGATVSAGGLTIGNSGTLSSGNVDVEGAGSTLKILGGGALNIGFAGGGSGVLTIGAGTTLQYAGGIVESGHASFNNYGGVIDPDSVGFTSSSNAGLGQNLYSLYVENIGAVQLDSGTGTWDTPMMLTGTSVADAQNHINNGDVGEWQLSHGGTLVINTNTIDAGQAIIFEDASDTLVIGQIVNGGSAGVSGVEPTIAPGAENVLAAGGFAAQIWGYQSGDRILFNNLSIASDSIVNGNTLDLYDASHNLLGALTFYTQRGNQAAGSSTMNAAAVQVVLCFAAGTRLRTARGAVAVEALREGDAVWSVLGERFEPVQWIGHRPVNCRAHPRPETVWPVVVSAGAFGPGLPVRDLVLSPDHALFVNDVLVPVKLLVNDTTIRQEAVDAVTYYHVELPTHDVVLAEGVAAESYLDVDDRSSFANGGGVVALHPEFAAHRWEMRWEAEACAPLVVCGAELEAARAMVAAQAIMAPAVEAGRHASTAA